jgi:hypothetical protein
MTAALLPASLHDAYRLMGIATFAEAVTMLAEPALEERTQYLR